MVAVKHVLVLLVAAPQVSPFVFLEMLAEKVLVAVVRAMEMEMVVVVVVVVDLLHPYLTKYLQHFHHNLHQLFE